MMFVDLMPTDKLEIGPDTILVLGDFGIASVVPTPEEERLLRFLAKHPGTTLADVRYSARVHKADFQKWRRGELKPTSVMSKRIEDVLSGASPLRKKPHKIRPNRFF